MGLHDFKHIIFVECGLVMPSNFWKPSMDCMRTLVSNAHLHIAIWIPATNPMPSRAAVGAAPLTAPPEDVAVLVIVEAL